MSASVEGSPDPARDRGEPALWPLYALFLLSGLAALVYEVMWMRSFGLVFGSTTRAASVVLATFFLGMAVGNWLGGRLLRDRAGALRTYAWLELGVAVGALAVLVWIGAYREVYPFLYRSRVGGATGLTLLQIGLALLAMAPPCIAMGATLPLVSRAVVTRVGHLGRRVGSIYALNTVGATAGALLAGFVLPLRLGVANSIFLAAALNVAVGGLAFVLASRWARWEDRAEPAPTAPRPAAPVEPEASGASVGGVEARVVFAVAAVSGLGTLALEVLYTRLIVNKIDSSVHSFAVTLAIFLVSLAIGSVLVSAMVDRLRRPWALVAGTSLLGAVVILLSPTVFAHMFWVVPRPATGDAWEYFSWLVRFAAVILAPPAIVVGMILPATWKLATHSLDETSRRIGRLTGVNTLAAALGSLGAGFVLIPQLGVGTSLYLVASLYLAIGLVATRYAGTDTRRWLAAALVVVVFAGLTVRHPWKIVPVRVSQGERLIYFHEGESASVSVLESQSGRLLRLNNIYGLGGSSPSGIRVHRAQGELGLALHGEPRDVAFIGVATGLSLSSIKGFPSVRRAVAMEVVPGVLEAARLFGKANQGVLDDPRVVPIVADGRNHLFGTDERFDVLIGDLFVPWHAGTGYLYTAEHFQIVLESLNPGGVFVQWFQLDQLSAEEFRIVVGTFSDVFEDAQLWMNALHKGRVLAALVGRSPAESGPADPPPLDRTLAASRFVCGAETLRSWAAGAPRNTDDFPVIEFLAATSHLRRGAADAGSLTRQLRELRLAEERRRSDGS